MDLMGELRLIEVLIRTILETSPPTTGNTISHRLCALPACHSLAHL
jgi:hypothetical protein